VHDWFEKREHRPLLVAQVDSAQDETTGDFYYRAFAPGTGMAHCDGVHVVNFTYFHRLRHRIMRDADVLVLNNICDADLLPVIRDRKTRGKPTVYELCDDLWALPASNPMRAFYSQSNNLLLIKRLAHYCDALQFSSPELERKFGYLNSTVRVFPNQILEVPPERNREERAIVRVGWGGSIGHLGDMAKISDLLVRWVLSRQDVHLYLMCADPVWKLFDSLPENRKRRFATGSLADYYNFVSHLDIGLAPLEDTPFNRSRSDVKFLEYAAHGVVPVVQATGPYLHSVEKGRTGFFFNSTGELISTLDHLVSDASTRNRVSASARKYVLTERNYIARAPDRVGFYRSLAASENRGFEDCGGTEEIFASLCNHSGAKKNGRHLLLGSTRFELLLQSGILSPESSEAWTMFLEAMQIEPSIYLPYLFGAFRSSDPVRALKSAIERNPASIVSWIHLGKAYLSKGMRVEAVESFKSAAGIFPEYELPYLEGANCLREMGLEQDGIGLLKKAIELIPEVIRRPQAEE
jgi:glycosyltransferase involved in cell wall biosynthesis